MIEEKEELTFKTMIILILEWYHYLKSKWKVLFIAGCLGGVLGLVYSVLKKPVYVATLTYVVEDAKSSGGGLGVLASSFGFNVGGGGPAGVFSGNNLMDFFKSRSMVERTLLSPVQSNGKTISLAEMYIDNMGWKEDDKLSKIIFNPGSKREGFTRAQDSILGVIYNKIIKESLSVEQKDLKTGIGTITFVDANESFAKYFTDNLVNTVTEFYIETQSKKARENVEILERQTDSVRNELNNAIKGVAVANDNVYGLNPALNVNRVPSARRQVDVQANTAILTEIVKQLELARVTLRKETPLIQIIDEPILPLKIERLGKLKGIVVGGFLFGFFTLIFLILRKVFKDLLV
ncbi:lipopolysaccharide biosynthesis protein [Flavobacterium chuncheonense]|uniref:Lipopolysaccharide biosynthesis protein n=1 Tax=Flavobacterium chuncheonense TaxID=2026653 RepID=A0ABW5YJ46_9FLAO